MATWSTIETLESRSPDDIRERTGARTPCVFRGAVPLADWSPSALRADVGHRQVDVEVWPGGHDGKPLSYLEGRRRLAMKFSGFVDRLMSEDELASKLYLAQYPVLERLPELTGRLRAVTRLQDYMHLPAGIQHKTLFPPVLFIGPKGAHTPFHYDLNRTFLLEVWGRKRVRLVTHRHWRDFGLPAPRFKVPNFSPCRFEDVLEHSPDITVHTADLDPGDMLYIPYGWLHYVESLDTSVSLTYGWCSARDLPLAAKLRLRRRVSAWKSRELLPMGDR